MRILRYRCSLEFAKHHLRIRIQQKSHLNVRSLSKEEHCSCHWPSSLAFHALYPVFCNWLFRLLTTSCTENILLFLLHTMTVQKQAHQKASLLAWLDNLLSFS